MFSTFISSLIISFLINLIIIFLSHKHSFFIDDSNNNKPQNFHTCATPRAGGIGIFAAMLLLLATSFGTKLMIPVILAFLSGIFEDFHNSLSPKSRLMLQLVAALSAIYFTGAVVTYLGLGVTLPYMVAIVFSAIAIIGIMNAINIIDGFNGLASGVILLILLSFGIVSYTQSNMDLLHIVMVTAGATFAFFLLNFPRGKIFLGDGGAYMLGFIVGIIGIFLASEYKSVSPWYILSLFIYPVWEVLFSIVRKYYMGRSPMQPDGDHFHMLIYRNLTHSNPLTSLTIMGFILPFMTLSTIFSNQSSSNITISACFIVIYLILYRLLYRKDRSST